MHRANEQPYGFFVSENHWVGLWDFGWFEVASYDYKNFESDKYNIHKILGSLIANPFYQITETVTEGLTSNPIETHGPFLIKDIKVDDFSPITHEQFLERINSHFFSDPKFTQPPSKEQLARVQHVIGGLNINSADYYWLNKVFEREVGIFHSMFYEYIIINQAEQRLHICVVAYD